MELSYIISAVRRRLWLVVVLAALGLLVASLVDRSASAGEYEARAVLLIQPPTSSAGGNFSTSDPDRYVAGQLSVLGGANLAQRVAAQLPGETPLTVARTVSIVHQPKTDIVDVVAKSADPARAQQIANTYARQYIAGLQDRVATAQQPGITEFDGQIKVLQDQLAALQARIDASTPDTANPNRKVDSQAQAQYSVVLAQINELFRSKIALQTGGFEKVTSEVIEEAGLPVSQVTRSSKLVLVGGLVGGLALGLVAAILAARLSPMILDRFEVEQVLGQPVAGDLGHLAAFGRSRAAALDPLPPAHEQVVARLAARAEANAIDERPLVIAVVGTQRRAGTTTLALTLAGRFARTDVSSVLIDFDFDDPEITRTFAAGSAGIPQLLTYLNQNGDSNGAAVLTSGGRARRIDPTTIFSGTPTDRVRVIGMGNDPDTLALRRSELARVLEYASTDVGVVIVDVGSLPDAAVAEQLVRLADCVVLAVPLKRLRAATLEANNRLLSGRTQLLLPVITAPARFRASRRGGEPQGTPRPVVEPTFEDDRAPFVSGRR